MKKHGINTLLIGSAILTSAVHAAIPNTYNPKTYLGTVVHVGYADLFNDNYQYSLALEASGSEQRAGVAGGYRVDEYQRFKVYAEYLRQDIGYPFFSGDSFQWMSQSAVDFRYQYRFITAKLKPSVDIAGYLANATDTTLRIVTGTYTPASTGVLTAFTNNRRIGAAFSNGLLAEFGMQPWQGNTVGFDVNYDNVRYDMELSPNLESTGMGGGLFIQQIFPNAISVGGAASWRQPFNNYIVNAALNNVHYKGSWTFGAEWDYVRGKNTLPSTYNVGLFVNYSPELSNIKKPADRAEKENLLAWIAKPAVAMPQVLAIPDESVT